MSNILNKCNSLFPTISCIGVIVLSPSVLASNVRDRMSQVACKVSGIRSAGRPFLVPMICIAPGCVVGVYHQKLWAVGMAAIVGVTHSDIRSFEQLPQIYAKRLNPYPANGARLMIISEPVKGQELRLKGFIQLIQASPVFPTGNLSQVNPQAEPSWRNNTYIEGSAP